MTVFLTGWPGNVATPLLELLLSAGADVRVGVRPGRAAEPPTGAAAVPFDFTDATTFGAFAGADTLFLLRPPQLADVERDLVPALQAARSAGIRHVVFLSIQGAGHNRLVPHHAIEAWLRASGMTWTFVRAAYFMQNLVTMHLPELRRGELFVPAGRGRTALVDVWDVAGVAAVALLAPAAHRDRVWTVTGPQALTYDEVARVLSQAWGRPIRYTRPGFVGYWRRLRRRGVPAGLLLVTCGIYLAARLGLAAGVTDDVRAVTGRAPRDLATAAPDLEPAVLEEIP